MSENAWQTHCWKGVSFIMEEIQTTDLWEAVTKICLEYIKNYQFYQWFKKKKKKIVDQLIILINTYSIYATLSDEFRSEKLSRVWVVR